MTEEHARDWLASHFDVSRETWARLERYIELLLAETERQNLIARSTIAQIWNRHIVDSAQLLHHAPPERKGIWLDLGSGAGLPGIIIALLSQYRVFLIEMRRKRVEFLNEVIADIGIGNVSVILNKVEKIRVEQLGAPARVISARAYAPMDRLIPSARHLADKETIWLLPKGQNYQNELAIARSLWHSHARVEQSITAADSAILVLGNSSK